MDERGPMTFAEVEERTNALARSFRSIGIDEDSVVALMCRNHRGVIEATVACAKVGADILYLDPDAVPSVLAEATWRRRPNVLIHDEDLSDRVGELVPAARRIVAWCEPGIRHQIQTLEELVVDAPLGSLPQVTRRSEVAFTYEPYMPATSSKLPCSLITPGTINTPLPLRRRDPILLAAPLTTRWGFLNFTLGLRFASTVVLMRNFDPEAVLGTVDDQRIAVLAVSREMLVEITSLPLCRSICHDTESLNVICVPEPFLPGAIAMPAIERFGHILYNLRGTLVIKIEPELWSRCLDPVGSRSSGGPISAAAS